MTQNLPVAPVSDPEHPTNSEEFRLAHKLTDLNLPEPLPEFCFSLYFQMSQHYARTRVYQSQLF